MTDFAIYHGGCPDGFTSAWLLRSELNLTDDQIHAGSYGADPPWADIGGDVSVILADFSYPRKTIVEMAKTASDVTILDHHATARDNLVNLPDNVTVHFDMERSGARLTADWLGLEAAHDHRYMLVEYVEDRDLWRFDLPNSKAIAALILATPFEWEAWSDLADLVEFNPGTAITAGRAVESMRAKVIDELVERGRPFPIGVTEVLLVESPYAFGSDVAGRLAERSPSKIGAYVINHPDGSRQYGLRSTDDGPNVAVLAEAYGGGGHPHASGFTVR